VHTSKLGYKVANLSSLNIVGNRCGRFAREISTIRWSGRSSTDANKNTNALSARFCVLDATSRSTARKLKNALTSLRPTLTMGAPD
jgi:hypothetical protein